MGQVVLLRGSTFTQEPSNLPPASQALLNCSKLVAPVCVDMCVDICVDKCADVYVGMCADMCICMCVDKCGDVCYV